MTQTDWLAQRFEEQRPRLRAVAYQMLGSAAAADDAVQDTWLRVSRAGAQDVGNLSGWLTTVVARVCLNVLSRRSRRKEALDAVDADLVLQPWEGADPESQALIADSVGAAMLVVLDTLTPNERLAFVLHDVFGLSFAEIAPIVDRSPEATRQLASRARRRVRGASVPETDLRKQKAVVAAFLAAARDGEFEALLRLLHPNAVVRAAFDPRTGLPRVLRGAEAVAVEALSFAAYARGAREYLVNGRPGIVSVAPDGRLFSVLMFDVRDERIAAIDIVDPRRLESVRI